MEPEPGTLRPAHDLVREVVLDALGPARRADVHRRLADVLDRASPVPAAELALHRSGAAAGVLLGGILVETASLVGAAASSGLGAGPAARYVVVGVGINVRPPNAQGLTTPPASLQDIDGRLDAPAALLRLVPPLVEQERTMEFLMNPGSAQVVTLQVAPRASEPQGGVDGHANGNASPVTLTELQAGMAEEPAPGSRRGTATAGERVTVSPRARRASAGSGPVRPPQPRSPLPGPRARPAGADPLRWSHRGT